MRAAMVGRDARQGRARGTGLRRDAGKSRDRHYHADPRLVPVLFGQKVNGEIGPEPVSDVGEGEIGGFQRPVRPPFWIAALRHADQKHRPADLVPSGACPDRSIRY
jgi:hypothetical protein